MIRSGIFILVAIPMMAGMGGFAAGYFIQCGKTGPPGEIVSPGNSKEPRVGGGRAMAEAGGSLRGTTASGRPERSGPEANVQATDLLKEIRGISRSGGYSFARIRELRQLVDGLPLEQIPEAVRLTKEIPNTGWELHTLRQELFMKWAERDVRSAIDFAASELALPEGRVIISQLANQWVLEDERAAMAWIDARESGVFRNQILASAIGGIALEDPARAFRLMSDNQLLNQQGGWALSSIFTLWGTMDRAAATGAALGLPPGQIRTQALGAIAQSILPSKDVGAAVEWAYSLPGPADQKSALHLIVQNLANTNPQDALELAAGLPGMGVRNSVISQAVRRWAETDMGGAMAYVRAMPPGAARGSAVQSVAMIHAQISPEEAANFVLQESSGADVGNHLGNVVSQWAANDTEAAMRFIAGLSDDPALQARSIQAVAMHLAHSDAPRALSHALLLPPGESRKDAIGFIGGQWARNSPAEAMEWLRANRKNPDLEAALPRVIGAMAELDPSLAIESARLLSDGALRSEAFAQAASSWSNENPKAAATWAGRLPEEEGRERAVQIVIGNWTNIDSYSASVWLESLPQGPVRNEAVSSFAGQIAREDPEAGAIWASTITDETMRINSLENIARQWIRQNRPAGEAWLATADLPEARKQRLLK